MQAANSYKVLVVEDEGLIAHDIAARLEALGHRVVATVETADEAVEKSAGVDLVLMDIHIDGQRDGISAADHGLRLIARGGRELAVEGTVAPVRSSSEALLGVVLTLRDVSARRWEERQLRQAQRVEAAGRLAARVAAEYDSLLQIIRSRTSLLARQLGDYSTAQTALGEIREAAIAAEQLTEKLAGLGARQVAQPEIVSLNTILRRMSKTIELAAGGRVVTAVQPEPEAGRIKADPAQIEQVIMTLVLHACAMLPQGGRLLIQTGRTEAPQHGALATFAFLRLTYAATEPDLDRLFDPAGSGQNSLALSVAHSIAAEHGGYLTARPVTEGIRIELLLPRVSEEAVPRDPAPGAGQALTILLVDGRDRVRAQLHKFFESAGYNLLEASDREEASALGQVHEGPLDLLIADAADRDAILDELRSKHPGLDCLTMVDAPVTSPREIRRPFTQQQLLERTSALLERREAPQVPLPVE